MRKKFNLYMSRTEKNLLKNIVHHLVKFVFLKSCRYISEILETKNFSFLIIEFKM